jgi:acyl-CoA thioesterase-2
VNLVELLSLEPHGPDTFVGQGLAYPWGGLYGGHIVAQALRAAAATVEEGLYPHSLRAYFIRRGDNSEPVRYEVDRIRNGRSFCTRRVVARQSIGAILNLEASFQRDEASEEASPIAIPIAVELPAGPNRDRWIPFFERYMLEGDEEIPGHVAGWYRVDEELGDDRVLNCCALAYLSDDLPTDAVVAAHPVLRGEHGRSYNASLDHTIWFHRPARADRWQLHSFACHAFVSGRGLAIGHLFAEDGSHVATIAQEALIRIRPDAN